MSYKSMLDDFNMIGNMEEFISENEDVLRELIGKKIDAFYIVWDCIDDTAFEDAPILLEYNGNYLAVTVHGAMKMGLVLNKLFPDVKPRWLPENMPDLDWEENLEWRKLDIFKDAVIKEISFHASSTSLSGITFSTDHGKVAIADGMDTTVLVYGEAYDEYVTADLEYGTKVVPWSSLRDYER